MKTADVAPQPSHIRGGVWLDPSTGCEIARDALLREMASRQAVLLGETHTVYEIHR